MNGKRPAPQGIPGARSNLPGEQPQPGVPETTNNVDKELRTRNYNVPTRVANSKTQPRELKNISVAVMIDGKRVPQLGKMVKAIMNKEGEKVMVYQEELVAGRFTNFSAIVTSAIGLNSVRE